MFKVFCPIDVIDGWLITKEVRKELFGQVAGGSGSMKPEEFQRRKIIEGTGIGCSKTYNRLNIRNYKLYEIHNPNKEPNGFDFTENFDGLQKVNDIKIFINLKCVVGKGGSQTRSLREVYWFIQAQLNHLNHSQENVLFANILDGDEAENAFWHYKYLQYRPEYSSIKDKIYIGDLKNYFDWFKLKTNSL